MSTGAALRAYLAASSPPAVTGTREPPPAELVGRPVPPRPVVPELPPLPEEVVVHRRLKSAFIDLDALVASLRVDRLTGYLRAQARDFEGILLFARGERGLSCFRGESVVTGPRAGELVRSRAVEDDVLIDVVRVRAVTAGMLPHLFTGPARHLGFTRFLDLGELVASLVEEGTDAVVMVSGQRDTGVVVVRGGRVDSAWTRLHPRPLVSLEVVLGAAPEPAARVEIFTAPED